jgi:hypothetical protein
LDQSVQALLQHILIVLKLKRSNAKTGALCDQQLENDIPGKNMYIDLKLKNLSTVLPYYRSVLDFFI